MKRILLLINDLGVGGAQKVFLNDAKDLVAEGYEVKIVTLFRGRDGERTPDVCLNLKPSFFGILSGVFSFRRLINEYRPDVVLSTLDEANFLLRITKVFIWDNTKAIYVREANEADKKSLKYKVFDIITSFLPIRVIAVSEAVRKTLASYMLFGADKITVVSNGIVIKANVEKTSAPGVVTILNVASLTKKKNQHFLLRAFALAIRELEQSQKQHYENVSLVIAGQGEELESLQKLASDLAVSDKVKFVGKVAPEVVGELYARADIFCLSSSREGFPNVLLEAMNYSLPIIATNAGASSEIVESGKSGYICHKGDSNSFAQSLVTLIQDKKMRQKMGQLGRLRLEQFYSQEKHMAKLKSALGL